MMTLDPDDQAIAAMDDNALRARLARSDWAADPLHVSDECVCRLFYQAQAVGDQRRIGLFTEVLSERILCRSRSFVLRSKIVPGLIADLSQASHELASNIWTSLLAKGGDAAHAVRAFGQFFKRRGLDFQRKLLAKKRKLQVNVGGDTEDDDSSPFEEATDDFKELQDHDSPELLAARRQEFNLVHARLLEILTQNEYQTYVYLRVEGWQVQEIAKALDVTVKSINNYKNSALQKIAKEFKQ